MSDLFRQYETIDFTKPNTVERLLTGREAEELLEWLEGPEACNFRGESIEDTTWDCTGKGHEQLKHTRNWLVRHFEGYPDKDERVQLNLITIVGLGGHCDCEVVFNVGDNWNSQQDAYHTVLVRQRMWQEAQEE